MAFRWAISCILFLIFIVGFVAKTGILPINGGLLFLVIPFLGILLSRVLFKDVGSRLADSSSFKKPKWARFLVPVGMISIASAISWFFIFLTIIPDTQTGVLLLLVPACLFSAVGIFALIVRLHFWIVGQ